MKIVYIIGWTLRFVAVASLILNLPVFTWVLHAGLLEPLWLQENWRQELLETFWIPLTGLSGGFFFWWLGERVMKSSKKKVNRRRVLSPFLVVDPGVL